MSEPPNVDIAKTVPRDAFLDTEHLVEVIRDPAALEQKLGRGGNGQSTPQDADITPSLGQASTHPAPQPKLLHVKDRTRTTTDEVHPGWVRATSILMQGRERLRTREREEAKKEKRQKREKGEKMLIRRNLSSWLPTILAPDHLGTTHREAACLFEPGSLDEHLSRQR